MSKKIIAKLFNYASREGAKKLIIEGKAQDLALHYHFPDGEERRFSLPKKIEKNLSQAIREILALAPDELTAKKYCKVEDKNYRLNFYLTIVPTSEGEKIIINIIPQNDKKFGLKQLGLQKNDLLSLQKALRHPSGLIILSSPAEQGKSTVLSSLITELNTPERSLYFLGASTKNKINGLNTLTETRSNWEKVLTIDSDIIFAEMTDSANLDLAVRAASTGRLAVITMSAQSVWEVLLNYLKLKLPLRLKLDSLKLILNSRIAPLKTDKRGQIGLFEVLVLSQKIKKFISEAAGDGPKKLFWEKLSRLALKEGYEPLSFDHQKKIKNGLL
ncbi:MAG: ATPase, T2SS/T4P/T4SS family [Patescibacteria group bacterium]